MQYYNEDEALRQSVEYFGGDELAASVFLDKYALRDNEGNLLESTPEQMFRRLAKEFVRIEKTKFKIPLTEDEIFGYLDHFKYIVPQGSVLFGVGNPYQYVSLSNCFLVESPKDSYSG
ncbi:MAG: ribonucleotide reductase N-terminal alpha domain-containing protein, partial [Candidatus Pacearchaeota archaeon]